MILYAFLTNNQTIKNKPQDDNVLRNVNPTILYKPLFRKCSTNILNPQMWPAWKVCLDLNILWQTWLYLWIQLPFLVLAFSYSPCQYSTSWVKVAMNVLWSLSWSSFCRHSSQLTSDSIDLNDERKFCFRGRGHTNTWKVIWGQTDQIFQIHSLL